MLRHLIHKRCRLSQINPNISNYRQWTKHDVKTDRNITSTLLRAPQRWYNSQHNADQTPLRRPRNYKLIVAVLLALNIPVFTFQFLGKEKLEDWGLVKYRRSTRSLESDQPGSEPHVYYLDKPNIKAAEKEFRALLGDDRVSTVKAALISRSSTPWSEAPNGEADRADILVFPKTTEEVSAIAKICHKRRIPMVAYSGGTSLEGSLAVTTQGGVCIDFNLMNKILQFHPDDLDVVVQPGVSYQELNETLANHKLFFPPDPGPGAKIGGMISQSCSGTNAYRYGTMRNWVLGLTVVLADGTVIRTRHRPRKSNAGYDLTQLIVGSEGTLGLVTEAALRLTAKPPHSQVAVLTFPSTEAAVSTAVQIVQHDLPLAAIELLDGPSVRAANLGPYVPDSMALPESAHLFLKFAGQSAASVRPLVERVRGFADEHRCSAFRLSTSDADAAAMWLPRSSILWSILALPLASPKSSTDRSSDCSTSPPPPAPPPSRPARASSFLSADAAVPISSLARLIDHTNTLIGASGLAGACCGHVGDGNIHAAVVYDGSDAGAVQRARSVVARVQRMAVAMGGTVTGEHGVGAVFRDELLAEVGVEGVAAMRMVKAALDPRGLLNPGKVFEVAYVVKR